jgi:hypothetical protein
MDQAAVTAELNSCLLTDAEFELGVDGWASLEDPFACLAVPEVEDEDAQEDEDKSDDQHEEKGGSHASHASGSSAEPDEKDEDSDEAHDEDEGSLKAVLRFVRAATADCGTPEKL